MILLSCRKHILWVILIKSSGQLTVCMCVIVISGYLNSNKVYLSEK